MSPVRLAPALRQARLANRCAALLVTATLVVAAMPQHARAAAPSTAEIEQLYVEGQDKYAAEDFVGAAESWTRLLELMPESAASRAARENVLINVLAAHLDAYNGMRNEDGTRQIEHLRAAKGTLEQYHSDFAQIHGEDAEVGTAVQKKAGLIEQELSKAENELAAREAEVVEDSNVAEVQISPEPQLGVPQDAPKKQDGGKGLVITGSVVAGVGLVTLLTMVPIGAVRGKQAGEEFVAADERGDVEARDLARREGDRANVIAIAGGVVGGLLILGGAGLLVAGVLKQKKSRTARSVTSMSPLVDRGFGGFAISGRF